MPDSPSSDEFARCVWSAYASAGDAGKVRDFLRALCKAVDATSSRLLTMDRRTGRVLNSFSTDATEMGSLAHQAYSAHWYMHDPRMPHLLGQSAGQIFNCRDALAERTVSHSPFFQDFLIPHGR